mmetsp:Transcript_43530/g.68981  ORF Transcript_43530/g.68981 Transcript_43530/m.68981 type:complete len:275 (-) Transcript_43530:1064-1888(-)
MEERLVKEVLKVCGILGVVQLLRGIVVSDPLLSIICPIGLKGFLQGFQVLGPLEVHLDDMLVHRLEILLGLRSSGSAQALVVLGTVVFHPVCPFLALPDVKVALREELLLRRRGRRGRRGQGGKDLHQGSGKALQEVGLHLQQARPKRGQEIDHQTCNVVPIQVLVREDHHTLIPKLGHLFSIFKFLTPAQTEDVHQMLDLLVGLDLLVAGATHVQQLSLQREHAEVLTTHCGEPGDSQGLGRIALRQDQGAAVSFLPCVHRVFQLGYGRRRPR